MNRAGNPYNYVADPTKGRPLFNADLYFGVPDLDPEILANQISISVQQEDGTIVPVIQPIQTGAGGVPMYDGSPAIILINEHIYSFKALDRFGAQIYYQENASAVLDPSTVVGTQDTYADVRALTASYPFETIIVGGHSAVGDGGAGVFKKLGTVADNGITVLVDASGASWVRQYSGFASIEWAEGISTAASAASNALRFNEVLNLGIDVDLGSAAYNADLITVSNPIKIVAHGCMLVLGTNQTKLFSIESSDVEVSGVIFDGNGFEVLQQLVNIQSGHTGVKVKDCTVQNIVGVTGQDQYGIKLTLDNSETEISNIRFLNISNYNPIPAPTSAFNGGIVLFSSVVSCIKVRLSNIYCNNIWTDNIAGDIDNSDSDGIRITATSNLDQDIVIDGLTCIGVQKSALKVSNCKGLLYSNVYVSGTRVDVPMIAAVRVQNSDYSRGSNLVCKGYISRCMNIKGNDFSHSGIVYQPVNTATDIPNFVVSLQSDDSKVTKSIIVDNIIASNVNSFVNFDTVGTTIDYAFKDIKISNCIIFCRTDTSAAASRIRNCQDIEIDNVRLVDFNSRWTIPWTVEQCDNVKMSNIDSDFTRNAMEFIVGGVGVTNFRLSDSKFKRPDSQTTDTVYKSLPLQYTDGSQISGLRLNNVEVSVPSYSVTSNQTIVLCNLRHSVLSDLTMTVRDVGVAYPGTALFGTFDNCKIDGVHLAAEVSKTGTVYALQDDASSSKSSYLNITSDARGARTFGSSCLISNIAGVTIGLSDTGVGNTVGTTHVYV